MWRKIKCGIPYLAAVTAVSFAVGIVDAKIGLNLKVSMDAVIQGNKGILIKAIRELLIFAVLMFPANLLRSFTKGLFKKKMNIHLKADYIKKLFNKNINEFQKNNNAKYMSNITNDLNVIEQNLLEGTFELVNSGIMFVIGVFLIFTVSPLILVAAAFVCAINILITTLASRPLNRHNMERSQLFEDYTIYIKEVLSAFSIIKTNSLQEKVKKNFMEKSAKVQHKGYIIDKFLTYMYSLENANTISAFYVLLAISVYMAIKGNITLGGVVLVTTSIEKITYPIMSFSEWLPKVMSVKGLFNKMDENLKNTYEDYEIENFKGLENNIEFKNVSYSYGDNMVLEGINISFEKGKKYLIIGPSGGGKTTLLKLLRKYFNPDKGEIFVDNTPLIHIKKEEYFKGISNIEQQVFLFEDTLRNNITLYNSYSQEEIKSALEKAGLKEFILSLPDGLDTKIYDNGKNISGGEKSRIAIARGILRKADIIFLDEAFASLDSNKAKEIEKNLLSLEGITVINVSHVIFKEHEKLYDRVIVVNRKRAG